MSWNYRIVRYANGGGFGLHEVYYDKNGKPIGMTKEPTGFATESRYPKADILKQLEMARKDIAKYPIFDEPEEWK